MCSLSGIYHPHCLVQWGCHCSCMCIPVHSPWLPGYSDVTLNILIILTMAGLFLDKPHIPVGSVLFYYFNFVILHLFFKNINEYILIVEHLTIQIQQKSLFNSMRELASFTSTMYTRSFLFLKYTHTHNTYIGIYLFVLYSILWVNQCSWWAPTLLSVSGNYKPIKYSCIWIFV